MSGVGYKLWQECLDGIKDMEDACKQCKKRSAEISVQEAKSARLIGEVRTVDPQKQEGRKKEFADNMAATTTLETILRGEYDDWAIEIRTAIATQKKALKYISDYGKKTKVRSKEKKRAQDAKVKVLGDNLKELETAIRVNQTSLTKMKGRRPLIVLG